MDSFYVYDNWTTGRTRIHRGECRNCRYGQGMANKSSSPNGRWHGPLYDLNEARVLARQMGRTKSLECRKCLPEDAGL